jgi:hypothetical protein
VPFRPFSNPKNPDNASFLLNKTDILFFVEDTGAANFISGIPGALAGTGRAIRFLVDGVARGYLSQRGVDHEDATLVPEYPDAAKILKMINPRLVVVGTSENPDTLGLSLIEESKRIGIPSIGAVDGVSNSAYRFRGRSNEALRYAPDWLLVPDGWTKDSYIELGYPSDHIAICGHPQYDRVKAAAGELSKRDRGAMRESLFPGLGPGASVFVFVAEISGGLDPQQYLRSKEYTLTGRGESTGRSEIVIEEFLDALHGVRPRPFLVLRLHPKNRREEFKSYLEEFNVISQDGSPLDLIYAADFVVGMTSMLLLEAAIMGRPTFSIVPRKIEKAWLPTIAAGITPCAMTRDELKSILPEFIAGKISSDRDVENILPFFSTDKIVSRIEEFLR